MDCPTCNWIYPCVIGLKISQLTGPDHVATPVRILDTDEDVQRRNTNRNYQNQCDIHPVHICTFLKIHNDILSSVDNGKVTASTLLDLSAAFDTIDHTILFY